MNRLFLDGGQFLERAWRLQQRKVVGLVAGYDTQLDRRLSREVALDIADATINDMIIGDDMAVGADHEAGSGLVDQLGGLRLRRARRIRSSRRYPGGGFGRSGNGEVAGIGETVLLHLGDAVRERRQ